MSDSDTVGDSAAQMYEQTALISWAELARYFAAGKVLVVDQKLNLVEVAAVISTDEIDKAKRWLARKEIVPATDEQAKRWGEGEQSLWAVVTAPWVLVQLPKSLPKA